MKYRCLRQFLKASAEANKFLNSFAPKFTDILYQYFAYLQLHDREQKENPLNIADRRIIVFSSQHSEQITLAYEHDYFHVTLSKFGFKIFAGISVLQKH